MNQAGASLLSAQQPEEALYFFERSLEELITKAGQDPLKYHDIIPCVHRSHGSSNTKTGPQHILAELESKDDSEGFVYRKPFFFNPEAAITNELETPSFGAVILFNLALCYHMRACDSAQITALTLYDQCLGLLQASRSEFDCSNIIVAALNNKARICDHLKDFQSACSAYHSLADILGTEDVFTTGTIDKDDLQAICLNVYFFKIPTCASSA